MLGGLLFVTCCLKITMPGHDYLLILVDVWLMMLLSCYVVCHDRILTNDYMMIIIVCWSNFTWTLSLPCWLPLLHKSSKTNLKYWMLLLTCCLNEDDGMLLLKYLFCPGFLHECVCVIVVWICWKWCIPCCCVKPTLHQFFSHDHACV